MDLLVAERTSGNTDSKTPSLVHESADPNLKIGEFTVAASSEVAQNIDPTHEFGNVRLRTIIATHHMPITEGLSSTGPESNPDTEVLTIVEVMLPKDIQTLLSEQDNPAGYYEDEYSPAYAYLEKSNPARTDNILDLDSYDTGHIIDFWSQQSDEDRFRGIADALQAAENYLVAQPWRFSQCGS